MLDEEDLTGELRQICVNAVEMAYEYAGPQWHDMYLWLIDNGPSILHNVDPCDWVEFAYDGQYATQLQF